jgi:hypothetical protein
MKANNISLVRYIALRYADPVCSIDLSEKYLLYGTMLGTAACYLINQRKLITLSETQDEHVSGVKIDENKDNPKENKLFVCIGDNKIFIFDSFNENFNEIPKNPPIENYPNENEHEKRCEKCFTMLKNDYLVRTFIDFPADTKQGYQAAETQYSIKNLNDLNNEKMGKIKMSNYSVPFDFDGKFYIFVDFLEPKKREFNIVDTQSESIILKFELEKKKIGHISLLKILKNDLIFWVRDYNICEIRNLNNFDQVIKIFNVRGSEILAFDVIYTDENNFESLKIIFVDIYCNVFLYNYKTDKQKLLFNMEDLDIDQVIKDQRFFSMGYPYYIKVSKQYMAISSDYGIVLVQHLPFEEII